MVKLVRALDVQTMVVSAGIVPWLGDSCRGFPGTQRSFFGRIQDRSVKQTSTFMAKPVKSQSCRLRKQSKCLSDCPDVYFIVAPL